MLTIEKVDHIGIRISDKAASISFYQTLGFDLLPTRASNAATP